MKSENKNVAKVDSMDETRVILTLGVVDVCVSHGGDAQQQGEDEEETREQEELDPLYVDNLWLVLVRDADWTFMWRIWLKEIRTCTVK